jgi:D-aminopeptidase
MQTLFVRIAALAAALLVLFTMSCASHVSAAEPARPRARDLGLAPGRFAPGPLNAITDVAGVQVGHVTAIEGDRVRTGVTAVVPHGGNLFQDKVPAAVSVFNGFGKLVGSTQVAELGELETPILLTNTLAVWDAAAALVEHTLLQPGNEAVQSVNPVAGETNDGWLNDIRARVLGRDRFLEALRAARGGPVEEGSVGAGTGTRAFGYKGGIGTASRKLPDEFGGYATGVLVQTNFSGALTMGGVAVGALLGAPTASTDRAGSCMIVIATDAPLVARQLERLARRAFAGMARTGASFSHGSGDYAIAFSTAAAVRIRHEGAREKTGVVHDEALLSPLFEASAEATEEAIYNALLRATTVRGHDGHTAEALPIERVKEILARQRP